MDPDETLRALLDALKEHRWNEVETCAKDLSLWLRKGGFPPQTLGDKSLGNKWHRAVTESICCEAFAKAQCARMKGSAQ